MVFLFKIFCEIRTTGQNPVTVCVIYLPFVFVFLFCFLRSSLLSDPLAFKAVSHFVFEYQ